VVHHASVSTTLGQMRKALNSSMVKAQESTLKDFAKRFERGKLSFTGDVLQV
jgi:hypothetical protein